MSRVCKLIKSEYLCVADFIRGLDQSIRSIYRGQSFSRIFVSIRETLTLTSCVYSSHSRLRKYRRIYSFTYDLGLHYPDTPPDTVDNFLRGSFNPYPAICSICCMQYADGVAPDQDLHLRCLNWEVHCPLLCKLRSTVNLSADIVALRSDYADAQADLGLHCPHMDF